MPAPESHHWFPLPGATQYPTPVESAMFSSLAQQLIEALTSNIAVLDRHGDIVAVNRAFNIRLTFPASLYETL